MVCYVIKHEQIGNKSEDATNKFIKRQLSQDQFIYNMNAPIV